MRTTGSVLSSEAKRSERASDPTASIREGSRLSNVALKNLEERRAQLCGQLKGLAHVVSEIGPVAKERARLGAKLAAIEREITARVQMRLL